MDIGTRLREARLRRSLTLRDISEVTKIPIATLQAIECNDNERLPHGIFGRAFVRVYAAEVGLDPEELVSEYLAQFAPEPPDEPPDAADRDVADMGRTSRFQQIAVLVLGLAVTIYAYHTFFRARPGPSASESMSLTPVGTAGESPLPDVSMPAVAAEATALALDIHPRAACWVAATADLHPVVSRVIRPGEHVKIEAHDEVLLRVGDADGCTYSINGITGRPLGGPGRPAMVRITKDNFRTFLATTEAGADAPDAPRLVPVISPPQKMIDNAALQRAGFERASQPKEVPLAAPLADPPPAVVAEPTATPVVATPADLDSLP